MNREYCTWDLEIAVPFPQLVCPGCGLHYNTDMPRWDVDNRCPDCGEIARLTEWADYVPLGCTCAATTLGRVGAYDLGFGIKTREWTPVAGIVGEEGNRMMAEDVEDMIGYLEQAAAHGYRVITWNGLGFDFRLLALEHPSLCSRLRTLAIGHVDIAFQLQCERGYMIALDKAAEGLGVEGKREGMHGDLAPLLWNGEPANMRLSESQKSALTGWTPGSVETRRVIVDYVRQDAEATARVYDALMGGKSCAWITASGGRSRTPWTPLMSQGNLLTVSECLLLPEPKGWRGFTPRPRSQFAGWLED